MSSAQTGIDLAILVPVGQTLLLGTFGIALVKSMRGTFDLYLTFERVIVAFLALTFFRSAAAGLLSMADAMAIAIRNYGQQEELKTVILTALKKAAAEPAPGGGPTYGVNLPAIFEQAWRSGIWGALSTIVDWIFLIVAFLLESARAVLWKLFLVLFPVACGVYPITPKMLSNLAIYAVELALWFPVLAIVDLATGVVAKEAMAKSGSWGLAVVAVELLAVILILLIPSLTHKFLAGAFSADFDSQASLIRTAKKAVFVAKSWGMRS